MKAQNLIIGVLAGGVAAMAVGALALKQVANDVKAEGITIKNIPVINTFKLQGGGDSVVLPASAQSTIDGLPMVMGGAALIAAIATVGLMVVADG